LKLRESRRGFMRGVCLLFWGGGRWEEKDANLILLKILRNKKLKRRIGYDQ
jgi:hypothetical protein